jgi:hypothetical protein
MCVLAKKKKVCANHFFSHLEAAGATLGCANSNGWNLASVTASSDQALNNAKEEVCIERTCKF